jgi:hypothetical protein
MSQEQALWLGRTRECAPTKVKGAVPTNSTLRTHDHHIPQKTGGHGIFQTIRGDREDLRAWILLGSSALRMYH